MRNLHRALLAGSLGSLVALVAGCGGSGAGLLTGDQASALQNQLNRISSALSAGDCGVVRTSTRSLAGEVGSLPSTVRGSLRRAIDGEANQVIALSVQQCHPVSTTTTPTTPTTTTSTITTTTSTTTTPTTHTETTTTPTTTAPATTPTNPGNTSGGGGLPGGAGGPAGTGGASNGNGNGNGNGQ